MWAVVSRPRVTRVEERGTAQLTNAQRHAREQRKMETRPVETP